MAPTKKQIADCKAFFKGTTLEMATKKSGRIDIIVSKKGNWHTLEFKKGIGVQYEAWTYKSACPNVPIIPVLQGKNLPDTVRKNIDVLGIKNPKNIRI